MSKWTIKYRPEVDGDLSDLGTAEARRVLSAIAERLGSEPNKYGKPLSGSLAGHRRLRVGDIRIIYQVDGGTVQVLVVAIGPRRNDAVYGIARQRVFNR
jgi:mRNA interferase RelE/StbE